MAGPDRVSSSHILVVPSETNIVCSVAYGLKSNSFRDIVLLESPYDCGKKLSTSSSQLRASSHNTPSILGPVNMTLMLFKCCSSPYLIFRPASPSVRDGIRLYLYIFMPTNVETYMFTWNEGRISGLISIF